MPPKKTNRSPFGLFMLKMKIEDNELKNKPMPQMVNHCNAIYETLSPEVKAHFVTLSEAIKNGLNDTQVIHRLNIIDINSQSKHNINNNQNDDNDWDNSNVNFICTKFSKNSEPVMESSDEEMDKVDIDYERVLNAVESYEDFTDKSIVVISFNVLVVTHNGEYYPNEVGLTQFSLSEGIQQTYHKLIYNRIPNGYYSMAKEHSEKTHKIPLNPSDDSLFVRNYEMLFKEIYNFLSLSQLKDSKGKTLVFCKTVDNNGSEDKTQTVRSLKWLANEAKKNSSDDSLDSKKVSDFCVIDLAELLFIMTRKFSTIPRPRNLLIDDLSKSVYDYFNGINCDFHEEMDLENKYCALGVIKRLCYLFFDSFFANKTKEMNVKITDNHRPVQQKVEVTEVSTVKFHEYKPYLKREDRYHSNDLKTNPQIEASNSSSIGTNRGKPYNTGIGRGKIRNQFKKTNNSNHF